MKLGKLSAIELKENILNQVRHRRKETIQGGAVGEDCAVLSTKSLMFLSSDPITAAVSMDNNLGGLAIHISCNDIASCGAEPIAVILTIIMPPDANVSDIKRIMEQAQNAADELNIDIVGGHTEFSDAVNRAIISATAVGQADKLIKTADALPGDYIVMTKYAGLEGTAIIANDCKDKLALTEEEWASARDCYSSISVVKEGLAMADLNVRAMHDITEGGVLGAAIEMCGGNGLGAEIYADKIPLLPITDKICSTLGINPYRLISSGSMMAAMANPESVISKLASIGIKATVIGRIDNSGSVKLLLNDKVQVVEYQRDEINQII